MDFELAPDDDPRRQEIRAWLAEHPQPTGEQLARAGYVAPHWPRPWGLDADPMHQLIIDEELKAARVARPQNAIGIGWAGPTILYAGTDDQKARYLSPILTGEEVWCQMFSEPEAGSDLASLATRAVRDGDRYIVNGSKTILFGTVLEIGGGTAQVQRNIIAERVLGLPHDVDVQAGLSWSESRRSSGGERTSAQPAARAAESASAGRAVPG